MPAQTNYLSPVLTEMSLEELKKMEPLPTCAMCQCSLWFKTSAALTCFCRIMHVTTWESGKAGNKIIQCDGKELAVLEAEQNR